MYLTPSSQKDLPTPYGITGTKGARPGSGGISDILDISERNQGHYGLLTNFYFAGAEPTVTEITTEDVDTWLDINFTTPKVGGKCPSAGDGRLFIFCSLYSAFGGTVSPGIS